MRTFWSKMFGRSTKRVLPHQPRRRRAPRLTVEQLETRVVPIVGAYSIPAPVAPGSGFDGVVNVGGCTGTLLATGRHILTAAHCLTDGNGNVNRTSMTVTFEMPARDISFTVPQSNFRIHPGWSTK